MSFLSRWAFGTDLDEEQQRGDEADAKLAELNKRALDAGLYTPEQFAKAEEDREEGKIPNVSASVTWDGFKGATELVTDPESWGSDASKGLGVLEDFGGNAADAAAVAAKSSINKLGSTVLHSLPWWVYVILAIVVLAQLGILKRVFKK
jgi:hypothetical protein